MTRTAQTTAPSAVQEARSKSVPTTAVAGKKPAAAKTVVTSATAPPPAAKRPVATTTKRPVIVVAPPPAAAAPKTSGKKHAREEEESEAEEEVVEKKKKKKSSKSSKHKKERRHGKKKSKKHHKKDESESEAEAEEEEEEEEEESSEEEAAVTPKKAHLKKVHLADESVGASVLRNIRDQERASKKFAASPLAPLTRAMKTTLRAHAGGRFYGVGNLGPNTDGAYKMYANAALKARHLVEGWQVRVLNGAYQALRSYAVAGKEIKPEKIKPSTLKKRANSRPKTLHRGHIITYLLANPGTRRRLGPWLKQYLEKNPSVGVFIQ